MAEKTVGYWSCPRCHKHFPSQMQANMCEDLHSLEEAAIEEGKKDVPLKRNGHSTLTDDNYK